MNTDLLKTASTLIVSAGVGVVVTNAIKATTPVDIKPIAKIAVVIGTFVASRGVAGATATYFENQIDEHADAFEKARAMLKPKKTN